MKYNINQTVFVYSVKQFKTIVDCEIVGNTELYYMSDKTAYPVDDLISNEDCEKTILNMNLNIEELFVGLF